MPLKTLQCHAVVPSSCKEDAELFVSCKDVGTVGQEFLLTDPMPESATESLPESVVCVFPLGSELVFFKLPPTGQSILAEI